MVDRDSVIEGLEFTKAMITFNPSTGKDIEPENLNEDDKISYDACIGAITLLKEQNWIKCSDKMPEEQETMFAKFKGTDKWSPAMFAQSSEDVRVVIVFADGTRRVSHSHTIDGKWECEKSPVKRIVTHWMPNPELPKETEE